jgi:hypothetical protein
LWLSGAADLPAWQPAALAGTISNLRYLELSSACAMTDSALLLLAHGCPLLRTLVLAGAERLGEPGVAGLVALCPLIRRLVLTGAAGVGDGALRQLARLPGLQQLDVSGCRGVNDAGVVALLCSGGNPGGGGSPSSCSSPSGGPAQPEGVAGGAEGARQAAEAAAAAGEEGRRHLALAQLAWLCGGVQQLLQQQLKPQGGCASAALGEEAPLLKSGVEGLLQQLRGSSALGLHQGAAVAAGPLPPERDPTAAPGSCAVGQQPQLHSFKADGCKRLTDVMVAAMALRCPGVHALSFEGCSGVTDAGLLLLWCCCRNLRSLGLSGTSARALWLRPGSGTGLGTGGQAASAGPPAAVGGGACSGGWPAGGEAGWGGAGWRMLSLIGLPWCNSAVEAAQLLMLGSLERDRGGFRSVFG